MGIVKIASYGGWINRMDRLYYVTAVLTAQACFKFTAIISGESDP